MKITTLLLLLPVAAAAQQTDAPEITISPATIATQPAQQIREQSKGSTRSTVPGVTKGYRYMIGAIVCPDYDRVRLIWDLYGEAVEEHMLASATHGQSELLHGRAYTGPNVGAIGCNIVPAGTPVQWERDKIVPVISGRLPSGKPFRGVTMFEMVDAR